VGIGASAGGLQALSTFFEHMPSGSGMAFVVILHLSPKHESHVDHVLQGVTGMPVIQVTQSTAVKPDHIYVISPNKDLQMSDGYLTLADPQRNRGRHTAIDLFFRTLAHAHKSHAVGIVLSGTGSDGTIGLKSVKEQGGIAIAQLPQDAQYDGMPRNAIGTGVVDFVLPVHEIPQRVIQLWHNSQRIQLPTIDEPIVAPDRVRAADEALREILLLLRSRTGHDFLQYKRATVLRRIERRLQVNQLRDLPTYRTFLRDHAEETALLMRDLLISVTNFFRDHEAFDALERNVIPSLFEGKAAEDQVRVWVAGCATGEEAYSITMLLMERAHEMVAPPTIQVFATDIDDEAIGFGRIGLYPEAIVADVSPTRLRRFFTKEAGGYRVQKSVREAVMFAPHNLIKDPPFSRLDLVSCRNLLIYLNRDIQARVLDVVHFALRPMGYLFLGNSESVDDAHDGFNAVDKAHRIYRPNPSTRAGAYLPGLPITQAGGLRIVPPAMEGVPRKAQFTQLHQALLERYAPPSVVINDQYDIVHLSDTAGRFLEFNAGEPSLNLMKVVAPDLRLELRAALYQAMQSDRTVTSHVNVARGGEQKVMRVVVHPVREESSRRLYALVIFDEQPVQAPLDRKPLDEKARPVLEQLESELQSTKEQLRSTIEQYETQNEELKAGNEELQAINEELRSATEELETSKEELQSINEELTTVNQELKNKIDETTSINNDLQNLIASTEIPVLFVDRGLRLMRYTPQARSIFNVIASDIGRPLMDITHRVEYADLQQDVESVLDSLRMVEREIRGDNERWYIARILPYRTTEDRIGGAVITFIDTTARKAADERVRRSEEWLRLVVDSVQDYAILTLDRAGLVTSWNAGAQKLFGYDTDEILGRPAAVLYTPEDREARVPDAEMTRARDNGRADDERWHQRKDGSRFYVSGIMAPLVEGSLYGYVKVARDLTEQERTARERELALDRERAAREMIEDANRQKDQFLATLSHELRNPLNLILMQAQLLLRTDAFKDAKGRHTGEVIYQTAATQARLVDDLLDVSRVMTGKLAMQQQLVPLPFIVGDSIGGLSREAEQKGVVLDLDLTPEPLIVQADPVRVRQIAWNLLSNAIKFTPSGGKIMVRLVREGDQARLDVIDNGQGIEPEVLPHIFELFRQAGEGIARPQGGLGIGLALVHQLVELHGGRIEVDSEGRDKGARFSVWLPLYVVPTPDPHSMPVAIPGAVAPVGRAAATSPALAGVRVLVIDDGEDAVDAMRELLQMEGAQATGAIDAAHALDVARKHRFDVIVSDLAMPGMDGYALMREIRSGKLNETTPAIAVTGFNRPTDIARSSREGFAAHLSKPVAVAELVETIRRVAKRDKA
jgi:two-component system CheB/CheR fusion protein